MNNLSARWSVCVQISFSNFFITANIEESVKRRHMKVNVSARVEKLEARHPGNWYIYDLFSTLSRTQRENGKVITTRSQEIQNSNHPRNPRPVFLDLCIEAAEILQHIFCLFVFTCSYVIICERVLILKKKMLKTPLRV